MSVSGQTRTAPALLSDRASDTDYALDAKADARSGAQRRFDIPTLLVAVAVYAGFLGWTFYFHELPVWLGAVVGSLLLTWHGSLQPETIHGYPARSRRINAILGAMPLSLWIPYCIYRQTHLQHHRHAGRHLTEVPHDPETFYLPAGALANAGLVRRSLHYANCTLAGRMLLGPALAISTFWASEVRLIRAGEPGRIRIWLGHGMAVVLVLCWLLLVCRINLLVYLLLVVYPSVSLTHLRSFAEHRADASSRQRTRVVEAHRFWAVLFLNNNLHIAHHAYPDLPWHQLPRAWRRMQTSIIAPDLIFRGGYREVVRHYLFKPAITVEHPGPQAADAVNG